MSILERHWLIAAGLVLGVAGCDRLGCDREVPPASIDLVPAVPGLVVPDTEIRITLSPGGKTASWHPAKPAEFPELDTQQPLGIELQAEHAQYLMEDRGRIQLVSGEPTRVKVVPLDPLSELGLTGPAPWSPKSPTEKVLYVDTAAKAKSWTVSWREHFVLIRRTEIPASLDALARQVSNEWERDGAHRAQSDREFDQAVLLIKADADVATVVGIVEAMQSPKRPDPNHKRVGEAQVRTEFSPEGRVRSVQVVGDPGAQQVPAFQVRVALGSAAALPPRPAAPPALSEAQAKFLARAKLRQGAPQVSGRLSPEQIADVIQQQGERLLLCYQHGLLQDPNLQGRVSVRFVIGRDGLTSHASSAGSDLSDRTTVDCVVQSFNGLAFPEPEGGIVTAIYPLVFSPR